MVCVGVPIGSPAFVHAFVADQTRKMVQDVKELQLSTDPDIHIKLIKFCHNTRLAHLNRNLPPTTMANPACGVQTVDSAVVNEVLAKPHTPECFRHRGLLLWHKRFRWMAGATLPRLAPARAMP